MTCRLLGSMPFNSVLKSVVPRLGAAAAPGDLLEVHVCSPHPGPAESEILEMRPPIWVLSHSPGDFNTRRVCLQENHGPNFHKAC